MLFIKEEDIDEMIKMYGLNGGVVEKYWLDRHQQWIMNLMKR